MIPPPPGAPKRLGAGGLEHDFGGTPVDLEVAKELVGYWSPATLTRIRYSPVRAVM